MSDYTLKNGLIYSHDCKTVLGVDTSTVEFSGKIPYGAKKIDDEVFTECPYINMDLPDSIEHIGNSLFENSKDLKTVKLPAYIKDLPTNLFSGCTSLVKIIMPNQLNGFSEGLFKNCASLTEIPFRAGIKKLPKSVFEGCVSLKAIVIPPTVEEIDFRAMAGCKSLISLVLPESLQKIHEEAFVGCDNIQNIRISPDNFHFFVGEDGCLYERITTESGICEKLVIKIAKPLQKSVEFFKENVDDENFDEVNDLFFTNEDFDEEDDTFSAEITFNEEEKMEDINMITENTSEISETIASDEKNLKILLDSALYNKVLDFSSEIQSCSNRVLYVISELIVADKNGTSDFTSKLVNCCTRIAHIQEMEKVVFLYGLPYENEDFIKFFTNFVGNKDVVFACKSTSPSLLSEYGKKLCKAAKIDLQKEVLLSQRRKISIKNNDLIKIVIQDLK